MKNNIKCYKNIAPLGLYTKYMWVYKNFAPLGLENKISSCSGLAVLPFSSRGAAFLYKTFDCSIEPQRGDIILNPKRHL